MIKTITVEHESELAQCRIIRKKVFVDEQGVPEELEYDQYDERPDAAIHVLALYHDIPAGCGRLIPQTDDDHREPSKKTARLQRLAVLPEYRGKGVGKALVKELERHAREQGYAASMLHGQCHAEPFYAGLGYKTISPEPFEEDGIMHVKMHKDLR